MKGSFRSVSSTYIDLSLHTYVHTYICPCNAKIMCALTVHCIQFCPDMVEAIIIPYPYGATNEHVCGECYPDLP